MDVVCGSRRRRVRRLHQRLRRDGARCDRRVTPIKPALSRVQYTALLLPGLGCHSRPWSSGIAHAVLFGHGRSTSAGWFMVVRGVLVCCGGVWWCWRVVLLVVSSMAVERVRRVRTRDVRMVRCVALRCCSVVWTGVFAEGGVNGHRTPGLCGCGVPRQLRHAGSSQGLCRAFLRLQEKRRAGKRASRTSCIVFHCCAKRGLPRFDTTWWI